MIASLKLKNYRGFREHSIQFKTTSIIVGKNNAGKSTIVESLRLISLAVRRSKTSSFHSVPKWLDIPLRHRGVNPSLRGLEINLDSLFHQYNDPPATIICEFQNKTRVELFLNSSGDIHAVLFNSDGNLINSKKQAILSDMPEINILPQVAPLQKTEKILTPDYVNHAWGSSLAPLHFRNQINLRYGLFKKFKSLAESSWPGLEVRELIGRGGMPEKDSLALQVRDRNFVSEVGAMGHGLQMWLQAMWFLTYSGSQQTIILDEPDVYMHADLQRRIIRMVKDRYKQTIVATHSVEIMAEVNPANILVVDKNAPRSEFASSLPAVQRIIDNVGSVNNINLARLWTSKRLLMIEGEDVYFLKKFQNKLFPNSQTPIDTIPYLSYGGWSGWHFAIGSSMLLKNSVGEEILSYCLMDSDYHSEELIAKRHKEALERSVILHIWKRKEIENYLIEPTLIRRVINDRMNNSSKKISLKEVEDLMLSISDELYPRIFDLLATGYLDVRKSVGVQGANKYARSVMDANWKDLRKRIPLIQGKEFIGILANKCRAKWDVDFNATILLDEIEPQEIDSEVKEVLTKIERNQRF